MNFQFINQALTHFIPETILIGTFLVALLADLVFKRKIVVAIITLLGVIAAGWYVLPQVSMPNTFIFTGTSVFHTTAGMFMVDAFSAYFKLLMAAAGIVVILFSMNSHELKKEASSHLGEYYALIAAMMVGMFLMAGVTDILMMYIALELVSISSYILTGFLKNYYRSTEAAMKYVIFGAAASGLMLYGFSLLFGLTGSTNLSEIQSYLGSHHMQGNELIMLLFSGVLILAGFGYKISAVPFQFWTPDVYEGAPITITAFLSVASKAAGFVMLIRFMLFSFAPPNFMSWIVPLGYGGNAIIFALCVMTMTLGNVVAIQQTNMKRLLAYSSIAQAGYLLMGIVAFSTQGITAIMIYFAMYLFMNLGAFYVVQVIAEKVGSEEIEDFKGLAKRMPFFAAMLTIFMMSLTGIPLTAGFIGKFFLFAAVLQRGPHEAKMYWLVGIAGLNSVIALFYYIKVIRAMYLEKSEDEETGKIRTGSIPVMLVLSMGIPTILFGVWFSPIVNFAQQALMQFLHR